MLTFSSCASSSSGNLYRLSDGAGSSLLLECGLPIKKIRQALNHDLHSITACLLTHEHQDHAKAAEDIITSGIDLYCSNGTVGALGISGHRVKIIRPLRQFSIGAWTVLPFETQHDAIEPLGFLIANGEDKFLFCTDSFYIKHRFIGLTMIAIECNYSKKTLRKDIPLAQKKRLLHSHMSLETLLGFLQANDLRMVREIHLLHLSQDNSDEGLFKEIVQGRTGIPVYVAKESALK